MPNKAIDSIQKFMCDVKTMSISEISQMKDMLIHQMNSLYGSFASIQSKEYNEAQNRARVMINICVDEIAYRKSHNN